MYTGFGRHMLVRECSARARRRPPVMTMVIKSLGNALPSWHTSWLKGGSATSNRSVLLLTEANVVLAMSRIFATALTGSRHTASRWWCISSSAADIPGGVSAPPSLALSARGSRRTAAAMCRLAAVGTLFWYLVAKLVFAAEKETGCGKGRGGASPGGSAA